MRIDLLIAIAALPLLAACVAPTGGAGVAPGVRPSRGVPIALIPPTRPPERTGMRQAVVHREPGLESVIGATPAELTRQFGTPRLDVYEGDARKLQFTGDACVLDAFLYPRTRGAEPQVTYVEARRPSGAEADRVMCAAALKAAKR